MSKEDLRVTKTLESINTALIESLKTCPLSKITVDTLCREARINRSTFYKYYTDKYHLLNSFLDKILTEFKKNMDVSFINASPSSINEDRYSYNFRQTLVFLKNRQEIYTTLWNASIERNVYNEMIDIIQENIMNRLKKDYVEDSEKYIYL
jgi:AcrR family transcriptional regulator